MAYHASRPIWTWRGEGSKQVADWSYGNRGGFEGISGKKTEVRMIPSIHIESQLTGFWLQTYDREKPALWAPSLEAH